MLRALVAATASLGDRKPPDMALGESLEGLTWAAKELFNDKGLPLSSVDQSVQASISSEQGAAYFE